MNEFLSFSEDRRRTVCEQAHDKIGLPPATIEKDFWVCWTLNLKDAFPDLFPQAHFSVRAVSRERTFWEKAMLLHEETFRPPEKKRQARMARHYYDLFRLIDAGVGHKAAGDLELFERIATHRQIYFHYTWVDYDTLCPGRLKLVPSDEQLASWKSDYSVMKDEMFFGKPPEFEDLIQTAREFQDEFNRKAVATNEWKKPVGY